MWLCLQRRGENGYTHWRMLLWQGYVCLVSSLILVIWNWDLLSLVSFTIYNQITLRQTHENTWKMDNDFAHLLAEFLDRIMGAYILWNNTCRSLQVSCRSGRCDPDSCLPKDRENWCKEHCWLTLDACFWGFYSHFGQWREQGQYPRPCFTLQTPFCWSLQCLSL